MTALYIFLGLWVIGIIILRKQSITIAVGGTFLILTFSLAVWAVIFRPTQQKPTDPATAAALAKKEKAEARKERIDALFNAWDGSCRPLTALIKANMNDPSSYQNVETRYADYGDYLLVITKFRGRNAFGALVLNTVKAKVSLDGKVLDVISQQ